MHSNVNASHKILLGYILLLKEFMKIDHKFTRKI